MPRKKKTLVTAAPEEAFWVHDGPVLTNLRDLHHALTEEMSDEQFQFHVQKGKNDFVPWIKDVLKDPACAKSLARVRTRATAASKVAECLDGYK